MDASANSEDPDEVPNEAVFHQGLLCLLEYKWSSGTEVHTLTQTSKRSPSNSKILTKCLIIFN